MARHFPGGAAHASRRWILAYLCAAYFVVIANITLVIPVLPLLAQALGLGTAQRQWLLAAFPIVAFAANLLLGPWIDRIGRKPFLVAGALGAGTAFLTTACSSSASMIIAARALTGVFVPMMGATIFAAIADCYPQEQRARYSGYVAATAPVAQLLAMPLTYLAGQSISWRTPFLSFAVLCGLLALAGLWLPAAPAGQAQVSGRAGGLLAAINAPRIRPLLIAYFAFSVASFCFLAMYPMWLLQQGVPHWGSREVVLMFSAGGVAGCLGAVAAPRIGCGLSSPLALCAAMALVAAAALAIVPPSIASITLQTLAYSAFSFCRAAMLPIVMSSGMSLAGSEQRSTLNGLLNATFQSGAALGSVVGAWLYAVDASYWTACASAGGVFLLSSMAFSRTTRRAPAPAGAPA